METEKLARAFSAELLAEIGAANLAAVVAENRRRKDSTCASHDFCDANMVMLAAFEREAARAYDFDSVADHDAFNAAWDCAKARDFFSA